MTAHAPATSTAPWRPAHAAPEIENRDGVVRLADITAVLQRYQRNGPHVTAVMAMPTPGRVGDDLAKRWSATRADLGHLGATDAALAHLDRAVAELAPCGYEVLLTADDADAAYCWLTNPVTHSLMRVGPRPALIPALAEVGPRPRVVAAAVDRSGADLFAIDHAELDTDVLIDGEQDRIHKSSSDGHDQARNQRHSELVWNRNARDVADILVALAHERRATHVLLTGDERAVDLVRSHVTGRANLSVQSVQAGGRHEPDTGLRLLAAAIATAAAAQHAANDADLAWAAEELGQDDRAVEGQVQTLEAATTGRVKTLIVDTSRLDRPNPIDDVIVTAATTGARVVATHAPHLRDGVAALLRRPNHPDVESW
jgi:hypothetical protein